MKKKKRRHLRRRVEACIRSLLGKLPAASGYCYWKMVYRVVENTMYWITFNITITSLGKSTSLSLSVSVVISCYSSVFLGLGPQVTSFLLHLHICRFSSCPTLVCVSISKKDFSHQTYYLSGSYIFPSLFSELFLES